MPKNKIKRIGPSMQRAIDYVTRNPGCVMYDAAMAAAPHGRNTRNMGHGYNPVHRAIKGGYLVKVQSSNRGTFLLNLPQMEL